MNINASILAKAKGRKGKRLVTPKKAHKAAQALGSLGGHVGGPARAKVLTDDQRREIAIHAINMRWGNFCGCSYCK